MKCQTRILAGTAIGLFMAGGTFAAAQATERMPLPASAEPVILVQAEGNGEKVEKPRSDGEAPQSAEPSEQPEATPVEPQQESQPPAAEEPTPEPSREQAAPEPEAKPKAEPEAQREAEPEQQTESAEEPARKRPEAKEPQPSPAAEEQAPAEQPKTAPEKEPSPQEPPVQPAPEKQPEPSPAPTQATPEVAPAPEEHPEEPTPEKAPEPTPAPAAPTPEAAPEPTPSPDAAPQQPAPEATPQPTPSPEAAPGGDKPAGQTEGTESGGKAPVLDSQKQAPAGDGAAAPAAPASPPPAAPAETQQPGAAAPAQPTELSTPPADDGSAQREIRPADIQPVTAEKGRRIERRPEDFVRERPQGAEVVREIGDRVLIEVNNQVIVESNDRPRIARDAREVYYEELPRGRTREVIVRGDGSRVVTIRNQYGDVIRRARVTPDDREYVLVYVEDADFERVREWRDPGLDLPPLHLTIPEEEYILDAQQVEDPDVYYAFLERPPVERVERLYSIDEVKRSARIRDKTRRVDLDTITFEFGSADVPEGEIRRLEGVAKAMEKLLAKNPAETFLVEGHTDAVGSDMANLALSDRRAESVAEALTNVFGIPPENLSTQGYGEQYLKVRTQEPERENRRVAIRRITPLVAPVASAK